jgi:hypothetical protein
MDKAEFIVCFVSPIIGMILARFAVWWFASRGYRGKPFDCRSCMTFWLSLFISFAGIIWKGGYHYSAVLGGRYVQYGLFVYGFVFSFVAFLVAYFGRKDDV